MNCFSALSIVALCCASAALGRLLLTEEQIRRTIVVRVPTLAAVVILVPFELAVWLLFAALCFIGGSFYGLKEWALTPLENGFEAVAPMVSAIVTGKIDE